MPPGFRKLSSFEQFRIFRFLTRGEAPDDPELAAVTLDVAGRYQTQNRVLTVLLQAWPMVLALLLFVFALPGALDGRVEMVLFLLFIVLGIVGNIMLNPWTRPRSVARSMEASKRIVARNASREN